MSGIQANSNASYRIGAVFIPEPGISKEEVLQDLKNIRAAGLNRIVLWPAAARWDSKTPGELSFEMADFVMDTCHSLGIDVIIELMGQNPHMEFLPDMLVDDPDMIIQGEEARRDISQWANYAHPKVQEAIHAYLSEVVPHYRNHPALYAWDVFNETDYKSFDVHSERCFQQWLERKYTDIQELNIQCGRQYSQFNQVRLQDVECSAWSSIVAWADRYRFFADHMAECSVKWTAWVKELDSTHPVLIDNSHSITGKDPTSRCDDEWRTAKAADMFGMSLYPKSWGHAFSRAMISQTYDAMRSAGAAYGKPLIVSELQTHYQSAFTPGSEVSPQDLAAWTWMGIAQGASSFIYWRWRPFLHGGQITGRGLTYLDGSASPRQEAVRELAGTLSSWGSDFVDSVIPKATVGIVYSYESALHIRRLSHLKRDLYSKDFHGLYRAFWDRNIDVAVLRDDMLVIPPELRLLVIPCGFVMTQDTATKILEFASRGGTVVADARLGVSSPQNWAHIPIPGPGLSDAFGFTEIDMAGDDVTFIRQLVKLKGPAQDAGAFIRNGRFFYLPYCAGLEYLANPSNSGIAKVLDELKYPSPSPMLVKKRIGKEYVYTFEFGREHESSVKVTRQAQ